MDPSLPQLPPKKDVCLALLEGPSVFVHLDPRREAVTVPAWFKKQPQLVLQLGLNMPVPIPDLAIEDDGITCTLSFSRTPFWCRLPWHAIYAMVGEDGRAMIWPDDVPPEVASQMKQAMSMVQAPRPRPLAAVESSEQAEAKSPEKEGPSKGKTKPKVALRGLEGERKDEPEKTSEPLLKPLPKVDEASESVEDSDTTETDSKKGKRELPSYLRVIK
jgi:hypothetical protein